MGRRFESCRKRNFFFRLHKLINLKVVNSIALKNKIPLYFYYIGLFLLPSAFVISSFLLLIAVIAENYNKLNQFIKDKWNYPFIISGLIILLTSFIHGNNYASNKLINPDQINIWAGTFNWLPFFFLFWGFQPFLKTKLSREISSKIIIAGTIPVIFSGFIQYFFKIYGPFKTFFGLLVWYQKPIYGLSGVSGLFSNENYTGCWLNIIVPFCIASFFATKNNFLKKGIISSILLGSISLIMLTNSRSAILSLFITFGLFAISSGEIWVLFILLILIILIVFAFILITYNPNIISNYELVPNKFLQEFDKNSFSDRELRIEIWLTSINLIFKNPLIGIGPSVFPYMYTSIRDAFAGHPHNLFLELSLSYGLIVSTIIFLTIILLLYKSYVKLKFEKDNKINSVFDIAWFISFVILLISQMVDIQYFDGRISILFWLLLSGLKVIGNNKYSIKKNILI